MLHTAADELSVAHVAVLVEHPEAVRSALAAAANVLSPERVKTAAGKASGIEIIADAESPSVDARESDRTLSRRTRPGEREELLTSDELAERVGLKTRQSVHEWRKKGRIVGWQGAKRGYVFPAGQFDRRGRPLGGLERIVPHFGDGYSAWMWLDHAASVPQRGETDRSPRSRESIDRVAAAAKGDAQGDFA